METDTSLISSYVTKPNTDYQLDYPVQMRYMNLHDLMESNNGLHHQHDELELVYVKKGTLEIMIQSNVLFLSENHSVLINQHAEHSFSAKKSTEELEIATLLFHPTILFGYGTTSLNAKYLIPIVSNRDYPYFSFLPEQQSALSLMKNLLLENDCKQYGYEIRTKILLYQLWLLLLSRIHTSSVPTAEQVKTLPNNRVKNAINYIEEHYAEPITLEEIAGSIHVSKSECCRSFKRSLSMSPFEYLMKYRIYIASKRIASSDTSATSISGLAASVGFNNPSYFNKVFKEFIGCTPTQYRSNMSSIDISTLLPDLS